MWYSGMIVFGKLEMSHRNYCLLFEWSTSRRNNDWTGTYSTKETTNLNAVLIRMQRVKGSYSVTVKGYGNQAMEYTIEAPQACKERMNDEKTTEDNALSRVGEVQ